MPVQKELEFFSYKSHLVVPGFKRYLDHFSVAGKAQAVGEGTASYFWTRTMSPFGPLPDGFQTDIPGIVHQYLGDELRLIVTLRNPVERAVSAYLHYLAMEEINPDTSFTNALTYGGLVDMGFYSIHLQNWLEYYPLDQIKVLILETDIQVKPCETLSAVCEFLSVGDHEFSQNQIRQTVFEGAQRLINENGVYIIADGPVGDAGDMAYRDDNGQYWRQIISAGELQRLNDIFLGDVKHLDTMLGTSLVQSWGLMG